MKYYFYKKISVLMLIAAIIMTSTCGGYAKGFFPFEASDDSGNSDIVETEEATPYDEAIQIVCGLGFMDRNTDTIFGINDLVTYGDFKDIMYRISLREYNFENESDNITFSGIAKCFVDVLGYTPIAADDKFYYAFSIGLFKKIDAIKEGTVSKSQLAQIVYNALKIDLCEQTGFGDSEKYEVIRGKTLLYNMEIKEIKGFVNANYYMNFYSTELCEENEIEINRSSYRLGETNGKLFIGQHVVAYVDISDTQKETLLFLMKDSTKPQPMELKANSAEPKTALSNGIRYQEKTYKVSGEAHVIHNFKFVGKYANVDLSSLLSRQCKVELFDTNCDSTYDVVAINNIQNYIVKQFVKMNSNEYVITDEAEKADLVLNYSDDVSIYISSDGKAVGVETIKIGNVLSVTQSEGSIGKKIIKIEICDDFVDGNIVSVSDNEVTLDNGETYYTADSFMIQGNFTSAKFKIYFTHDGLAAYAKEASNEEEFYGFLVGAITEGSFSDNASFKIYTTTGEFEVLNGAQKITFVDGEKAQFGIRAPEQRLTAAELANHSSIAGKAMAVKYQLNEAGELMKLITPSDNSQTGLIDTENFSIDYSGQIRRYNDYYSSRFRSIGKNHIISVPLKEGSNEVDVANEDEFSIPSLGFDQSLTVTIYDALESGALANSLIVCSVEKKMSVANNSEDIAIVKGISTAYVNDDVVKAIKIYRKSGAESTVYVDMSSGAEINISERSEYENIAPSDLKIGDIIQYKTSVGSMLTAFRLLCRTSDNSYYEYFYQSTSVNNVPPTNINNLSPLTHGYGKIMAVDIVGSNVCMSVSYRTDEDPMWNRALSVGTVLCYDSANNKVSVVPKNEILKGDNVFYLHSWGYEAKTVIVVR